MHPNEENARPSRRHTPMAVSMRSSPPNGCQHVRRARAPPSPTTRARASASVRRRVSSSSARAACPASAR
eukprot:3665302-Pleurochrysis_carterae.AAC.1